MKRVFLTYAIAPMLMIAGILSFNGASANNESTESQANATVVYNVLATGCFATQAEAQAEHDRQYNVVRYCHLIAEDDGPVLNWAGGTTFEWCYEITGW